MLKLSNINYSVKTESLLEPAIEKRILENISFEIHECEILGIVGESGAGKTTLAKLLAGIVKPLSGEIKFKGNGDNNLFDNSAVQILFQNSAELLNPFRTVKDILKDVVRKDITKIDELLSLVELTKGILQRLGKELSGGERQRIGLIRVLAADPKVLIIDEPFSAQDVESQLNLMKLLKRIKQETNLTIVCVSHDLQIILKFTDRLIVMREGKIVEAGLTSDVMRIPKHEYTKFLINSKNYNISIDDFEQLRDGKS